jgi:hypothetical protein
MKNTLLLVTVLFILNTSVNAQLLEMAANCDEAGTKIIEIIKHPDAKTPEIIRDLFGVDIFNSCDSPDGRIVCFKCIDKNQKLNLIQLQENVTAKKFEFKGFGCLCDKKNKK